MSSTWKNETDKTVLVRRRHKFGGEADAVFAVLPGEELATPGSSVYDYLPQIPPDEATAQLPPGQSSSELSGPPVALGATTAHSADADKP